MKKVLVVDDQSGWIDFNCKAVYKVFGSNVVIDKASSADEGYSEVLENVNSPYDYILTDMQMEDDYLPKMAGEWLIEQIQILPSYFKTRIIIVSAASGIEQIAKHYGVFCIPKRIATVSINAYRDILI